MLNNLWIDLHVHTTASDGTFSPSEVVKHAQAKGLTAIAITDHDTVQGVAEAVEVGRLLGLEVIPGVEISVDHANKEMHILGYFIELDSPVLAEKLKELQSYRELRNPLMVEKLCSLGLAVTLEEVAAIAQGDIIGRPHFAALLVKKGYVVDKPTAFERYLAQGKPAYVKKEKLTPAEGIQLILAAGGIPVLAHPKYLLESNSPESLSTLIKSLKKLGLQGIEVYYSTHTTQEEKLYKKLANSENLLLTGGSDFHGDNKPEIFLGSGKGNLSIPYQLLSNLKELVLTRN